MGNKVFEGVVLSLLLLLGFTGNVFPQAKRSGSLTGNVVGSDGAPLVAANVLLVGTTKGAVTDMNGHYFIGDVEAGRHQLRISYVGYSTKTVDVDVNTDAVTTTDITLEATGVTGKEVIVTAQRAGQENAINRQISSTAITNVVASDRLQQNPDANAAEAIGRLPGISLDRTGGEGTGIVIRGLAPQYSTVLIDGIALPSTDPNDRSAGISGVSQYVLQGVEVFKSVTPDMEAGATAGAINLQLGRAPDGFKFLVMAQGGYNNLNNYFGNYKSQVDVSNRFFDDKLGVLLDVSSERVNRSAQTLSAGYAILSSPTSLNQFLPMYVSNINLNDISRINGRNSGILVFDYRVSHNSTLQLSNFFSNYSTNGKVVTKSYNLTTAGINYGFDDNPDSTTNMFLSSLKFENHYDAFDLNLGVAYAQSKVYIPDDRGWSFVYPNGISSNYTSKDARQLPLQTLISSVRDSVQVGELNQISAVGVNTISSNDMNRLATAHADLKIPYSTKVVAGNISLGAMCKNEFRNRYYYTAYPVYFPTTIGQLAADSLTWATNVNGSLSASDFYGHEVGGFLKDQYYFGWYPNFDRLNEFYNFYYRTSQYYFLNPNLQSPFPEVSTYFLPDYATMQQNNYRFNENYLAGYLMAELNFGDLISFLPGVRYEAVSDELWGWYYLRRLDHTTLTGHPIDSTHSDAFLLPNIHLKVKPSTWLNINMDYTETLHRPDFRALEPIVYVDPSAQPEVLTMGNPQLKPELWDNFDLQVAIFGSKVGYLGVTGFYKMVKNMIWTPVVIRTPGQPAIPGFENVFGPNATVDITQPVNNTYKVYIRGLEFEWQTNFWYLPSPLNYLTLNVNYTLMASATRYPRVEQVNTQVGTDSRGRPIYQLVTYYFADIGSMLDQPNNIVNTSVGYNYRGFNIWLSYSYTGKKLTSYQAQLEQNVYALPYSEFDIQATQQLPIKGLEVILDLANLNNATVTSDQLGDVRPTYLENYGWTADLGLRFTL